MGEVYDEVRAERERAHAKHGETSMESCPPDDYRRLAILCEEVGEVAREFNEGHHRGEGPDLALLRKELIQTAAMAIAWADAISETLSTHDVWRVGSDFTHYASPCFCPARSSHPILDPRRA